MKPELTRLSSITNAIAESKARLQQTRDAEAKASAHRRCICDRFLKD